MVNNKKRVAILSVADLRHMTCSNFFCEYLNKRNIDFDIICMNRYKEKASIIYKCGLYRYNCYIGTNANIIRKFINFFKFKKYALDILKRNNYDYIIVWGENAGILFCDYLSDKKYCLNVRDKLIGFQLLFKSIFKKAMLNAQFVTTPSPELYRYLHGNVKLLLNKDYQVLRKYKRETKLIKNKSTINIVYMGVIHTFLNGFTRFLDIFKNDNRFNISFYGYGADVLLKKFADENNIKNATFHGAFSPDETAFILEKTDIINSSRGELITCEGAVGVKQSYSPLLHIPVISDKGSYFAQISEKFGFGIGIDYDIDLPNKLFSWYNSLDENKFDQSCKKYASCIDMSTDMVERVLSEVI